MKLSRYDNFSNLNPINENLAKSKKFLKNRYTLRKAAENLGIIDDDLSYKIKEGDIKTLRLSDFPSDKQAELKSKMNEIRLSDDEVRNIERDDEFLKIREVLNSNPGYLYPFVYMYYVEKTPLDEIESLYKEVLEQKPILDRLESEIGKKFDINFIDTTLPNESEHRTNSELLVDGLEKLKDYKKVKKILNTLTSKLKRAYKDASEMDKNGMVEIAVAFDDIPETPTKEKGSDGNFITKKERIWKNFFGEMKKDTDPVFPNGEPNPKFGKMVYKSRLRRYESMSNPIRELVRSAKAHLDASMIDGYNDMLEKIEKCNDKLGILGCEVKFNERSIMILQINSYQANRALNSHTNHCIVNYNNYWDSYLGDYNKQYYLYNFNVSTMDDLSTIGVTIKPDRTWPSGGCQSMRNNGIGPRFKNILKNWEKEYAIEVDLFDQLEPMTDEEIEKRKRAKLAEREIVKPGLSIDLIKQYVTEDGADINKDNAAALTNAVNEDDYEKVKFCLTLGANPNLSKKSDSPIAKAKNLDMIKLLVTYNAEMVGQVFENIVNDIDALEYCLKAGLDPDFAQSLPFRKIAKGSWKSRTDTGIGFLEPFKLLLKYGASIKDERDRDMILKWAAEYNRMNILEYLFNDYGYKPTKDGLNAALNWMAHSRKMTDEDKEVMVKYLKDKIAEIE